MALKATIHKVELSVSDVNRHHYDSYSLTIARHPSENDQRMMIRLLAFAINAGSDLQFSRGLSTEDEPDIWEKAPDGTVKLWIEVGTPSIKRIRKACGKAEVVKVVTYQERSANTWWEQIRDEVKRFSNLEIYSLADDTSQALEKMAKRSMHLQCTLQDSECWISDETSTINIHLDKRVP